MAKEQRFERVYTRGALQITEIWVDKETGVNDLFHASGNAGGLTPLLDRVRQGSNGLDAGCHALEPGLVQREAVEHDVRDFAARGLEIGDVLRQNGRGLRAQPLRHGGKGAVFRFGVAQGRTGRRGLRALQNDLCRGEFHYAFSSRARNFVPTGLPSIRS